MAVGSALREASMLDARPNLHGCTSAGIVIHVGEMRQVLKSPLRRGGRRTGDAKGYHRGVQQFARLQYMV